MLNDSQLENTYLYSQWKQSAKKKKKRIYRAKEHLFNSPFDNHMTIMSIYKTAIPPWRRKQVDLFLK